MAEPSKIESIIEKIRTSNPNDQFRRIGESALRIGFYKEGVLVSWISQLSVRDFVKELAATSETVPRLVISRPSNDSPYVDPSRLTAPEALTDGECAAIFLIRDDIDSESNLVYEPEDFDQIESGGYTHITARTTTLNQAIGMMSRFMPLEAVIETAKAGL